MTQYLRYCSVSCGGQTFTYDASTEEEGLRIVFEFHPKSFQSPGVGIVTIKNPLPAHATPMIAKEFGDLTVDAGYVDGHGVLFHGDMKWGVYGRESPTDTQVILYASDGNLANNYATVSTTFPPGSTPQQHFDAALNAMNPMGVTKGYVGVDLSKPVYSRSVTLFGMARDVLATIARSKGAMLSYQQKKVVMVPRGGSLPGGPIALNSLTGLVGMPTQTTSGIMARCLINPNIKVHSQVKIDQKDIQGGLPPLISPQGYTYPQETSLLAPTAADGLYTVYKIDVFGDTRGSPWYMDLAMYATNVSWKSLDERNAMQNYGESGAPNI